jgi:hypothetical protein
MKVLFLHADTTIGQFEIVEQYFENVQEISVYFFFAHYTLLQKISPMINRL